MSSSSLYLLAADLVLSIHLLFVGFVVFGLIVIFIGGGLSWNWVRNPAFRITHLLGIGLVVLQSWLEVICPLTILENALREIAGAKTYGDTFISYWLRKLLYYDAPNWVFIVCYTILGILVVLSWFIVRPRPIQNGFDKNTI
jgi:ABC-type multidrug transport system permease subunit